MDEDGYPTLPTLARISEWDPKDFQGLAEFLVELWWYPARIDLTDDVLTMSTGGWSGNEELVNIIPRLWRTFHWRRSERGGHHVFTLNAKDPES